MKVYGISVHGYWTDEWNVRNEMQYGKPYDWKLFSKEEDAVNFRDEIVERWGENWVVRSKIDDAVFMRPRNIRHENDVMIFSIVDFELD